jgi:hypothetical protein
VDSRSDLDSIVSAYSSISEDGDSLTVILVNRDSKNARDVELGLSHFTATGTVHSLQLSGLSGETFVSDTTNAAKKYEVASDGGKIALTLPALSVTALRLAGKGDPVRTISPSKRPGTGRIDQSGQNLTLMGTEGGPFELLDVDGNVVRFSVPSDPPALSLAGLPRGVYLARWRGGSKRVFVLR